MREAEEEKQAEKARKQVEAEAAWLKSEPLRREVEEAVEARSPYCRSSPRASTGAAADELQMRLVVSDEIASRASWRELREGYHRQAPVLKLLSKVPLPRQDGSPQDEVRVGVDEGWRV